jgi:hypothetical protein
MTSIEKWYESVKAQGLPKSIENAENSKQSTQGAAIRFTFPIPRKVTPVSWHDSVESLFNSF